MSKTVEDIGNEILAACDGQVMENAHKAMIDAMATHIGGSWYLGEQSLDDALLAVADMARAVADHVEKNWGSIEPQTQH